MFRTILAALLIAAGIAGLGSDLAQTAYAAAHTARVVVLAPSA